MKCDFQDSFSAHTLQALCLAREPKARVTTHFMLGFRVKQKLKNNREIYCKKWKKKNLGKKKL
jgi:hypothetical protein